MWSTPTSLGRANAIFADEGADLQDHVKLDLDATELEQHGAKQRQRERELGRGAGDTKNLPTGDKTEMLRIE